MLNKSFNAFKIIDPMLFSLTNASTSAKNKAINIIISSIGQPIENAEDATVTFSIVTGR